MVPLKDNVVATSNNKTCHEFSVIHNTEYKLQDFLKVFTGFVILYKY